MQTEAFLKTITVSKNRKLFDDFSTKLVGKVDDSLALLKKFDKPSTLTNISRAVEKRCTSFHAE